MTEGGNANYRIEVISADMAKDTSFLPYAYRRTKRFNVTTDYFSKMFEESRPRCSMTSDDVHSEALTE